MIHQRWDSKTALCTVVHRAVKTLSQVSMVSIATAFFRNDHKRLRDYSYLTVPHDVSRHVDMARRAWTCIELPSGELMVGFIKTALIRQMAARSSLPQNPQNYIIDLTHVSYIVLSRVGFCYYYSLGLALIILCC